MSSVVRPIGIDLGTTYSAVAYLDQTGRPITIPNGAGDLLTPSAVLIDQGEVIIGKEAARGAVLLPSAFADCFKRDMGTATFRHQVSGQTIPPEILSGLLLERLKLEAEQRIGAIGQVVITVPAFFDESRRQATQEAGRLAGLEVLDIINEPTAAALCYGHARGYFQQAEADQDPRAKRVLVYDLGGGTFDVTILEVQGMTFRALATDGDVLLGGKDFDEELVRHLAEQFQQAHGLDPRADPADLAQLWQDAQTAKHTLSERSRTTVVMAYSGIRHRVDLTREQFEELTKHLLERTATTTSLVVTQAGLTWKQIDQVLLVGGSSRMPMVSAMLERVTGQSPDRSLSPDEAIAHGAALYCGMLQQLATNRPPAFSLINVNSHSLGVVGIRPHQQGKVNVILIPKNTPLPHQATKKFVTAQAHQTSVRVKIVEGESERPEACIAIGECIVRDLPPDLPQGAPIEVTYAYAANGTLTVSARVPHARRSAEVQIQRTLGRELEPLSVWKRRFSGQDGVSSLNSGPATSGEVGSRPLNRTQLLQRLDELYLQVGQLLAPQTGLAGLERPQQELVAALAEQQLCELALQAAQQQRQVARHSAEANQAAATVSQAQQALEQVQTRVRYAYLSLGRAAVKLHQPSADGQQLWHEIAVVRGQLNLI